MQAPEVPQVDREDEHRQRRRASEPRVVVVDVVLGQRVERGRERRQHQVDPGRLGVADQLDVGLQRRLGRLEDREQVGARLVDRQVDELAHLVRSRAGLGDQQDPGEAELLLQPHVVADRGLVEPAEIGPHRRCDTARHAAQVLPRPVARLSGAISHLDSVAPLR